MLQLFVHHLFKGALQYESYCHGKPLSNVWREHCRAVSGCGLGIAKRKTVRPVGEDVKFKGDLVFRKRLGIDQRVHNRYAGIVGGMPEKCGGSLLTDEIFERESVHTLLVIDATV